MSHADPEKDMRGCVILVLVPPRPNRLTGPRDDRQILDEPQMKIKPFQYPAGVPPPAVLLSGRRYHRRIAYSPNIAGT